jgi:hypothetical protein
MFTFYVLFLGEKNLLAMYSIYLRTLRLIHSDQVCEHLLKKGSELPLAAIVVAMLGGGFQINHGPGG